MSKTTIIPSWLSLWLSPPTAAREITVEPAKVIGWIRSGELPAVNVAQRSNGRARWRIRRTDWEAFLAARSNVKPVEPEPSRAKSARYQRKYY